MKHFIIPIILTVLIVILVSCTGISESYKPLIDKVYDAIDEDIQKTYEGSYIVNVSVCHNHSEEYPNSTFYSGIVLYDDDTIEYIFARVDTDGTISVFD